MVKKKDLQNIARNFNLRGWSRMNKGELIIFLNNYLFSPPILMPEWLTKKELQNLARKHNLRGWSGLNKEDLRNFIISQRRRTKNLMDLENLEISAPVLIPERGPFPVKPKPLPPKTEYEEWLEWLVNEPPPPPKPIQKWLWEMRDVVRSTAMRGYLKEMVIAGKPEELPREFFRRVRPQVASYLNREKITKVKLMLNCLMSKTNLQTGEYIEVTPSFNSDVKINLEGMNKFKLVDEMFEEVMVRMANYQKEGSNLQFEQFIELVIPFAKYEPLRGSSYMPLPGKLKNKKAIVNMKNEDNQCFKWCVTRALNQGSAHPERVTDELRKQSEKLDWSGISFPPL